MTTGGTPPNRGDKEGMAGFVQEASITSKFVRSHDDMQKGRRPSSVSQTRREAGRPLRGHGPAVTVTIIPGPFHTIVRVPPSTRAAMKNNDRPETRALSADMMKLATGAADLLTTLNIERKRTTIDRLFRRDGWTPSAVGRELSTSYVCSIHVPRTNGMPRAWWTVWRAFRPLYATHVLAVG